MAVHDTKTAILVKPCISAAGADVALTAAAEHAAELGLAVSIAVVDESGVLKSFLRQDGASVISGELAVDKAFTAVAMGFGVPTNELFDMVKDKPPLVSNLPGRGRLLFLGGGFPIKRDGTVIGAVGVAGGHYEQDMQIAKAAIAAIGSFVQADS
jgi:uncharacterized protein GlcG (DUF336 family)